MLAGMKERSDLLANTLNREDTDSTQSLSDMSPFSTCTTREKKLFL